MKQRCSIALGLLLAAQGCSGDGVPGVPNDGGQGADGSGKDGNGGQAGGEPGRGGGGGAAGGGGMAGGGGGGAAGGGAVDAGSQDLPGPDAQPLDQRPEISPDRPTDAPGEAAVRCGGSTGISCPMGQFCDTPCGMPNAVGVCVPVPGACSREYVPVCGCNGQTYSNDCVRRRAAAGLRHDGACAADGGSADGPVCAPGSSWCPCRMMCTPDMCLSCCMFCEPPPTIDGGSADGAAVTCGGITGMPCPGGERCELPAGQCSGADLAGTCKPIPAMCATIYAPVCGCDGKTYGNDCARQAGNVDKNHDGACN